MRKRLIAFGLVAVGIHTAVTSCSTGPTKGGTTSSSSSGTGGMKCVDSGERPGPRDEMASVFDEKRSTLVFFGGDTGEPKQCMPSPAITDETWTYDATCKQFHQAMPAQSPKPRARAGAAYDAAGDRMVMFGGRYRTATQASYTLYADVWGLDLGKLEWTELDMGGAPPPARSSTYVGLDTMKGELVVYGGNASTNGLAFSPLGDVWAFNLQAATWRQETLTGMQPPARLFHAGAIDPATRRLFVYGGADANAFTGPFFGDLWALDLDAGTWAELSPGGGNAPRPRISASLFFDATANQLVLFGGHDDGSVGNNNDTWTFDLGTNTWSNVTAAEKVKTPASGFCMFPANFTTPNLSAPDRRSAYAAGLDSKARLITIFGGATDCGLIDDVWQYDAAAMAWKNQVPAMSGEACDRGPNPSACTSLCQ